MTKLWRLLPALLSAGVFSSAHPDEVRVYEEPLTLPTYRLGPAEIMPVWNAKRGGVRIYPYTMLDRLTEDRKDSTYRALWLENKYVKVLVLPEIGGRIHGAQDKTSGYQFMFNQRSIKPALVSLTGAWISGGVEWNFPDGHRQSCFRPTDWRIVQNPDGSKTVWTGEIERVYGMRWSAGTTMHPGRNWVEGKVRLFNCTPYPQSFLYWGNCGVRGSPEFRVLTPGEIATGHGKHTFYHWPVDNGVDLRFWKNAPGGTSYFVCDSESDFYGCYSPEFNGGMVHWSDHRIARGKKIWFCGTSPAGRLWEKVLTDGDAPLVEVQIGAYSDNQPDYHWIMPGETKTFSHFWFPVRGEIGVWDYANLEGTLALRLEKGKVEFGWSPTGRNQGAQVIMKAEGKEFFRRTLDADPATPVMFETGAPKGADLYSLEALVLSGRGDTLLGFRHPRPANPPLPSGEPSSPEPADVESQDQLFLIGDRLERFRDPDRAMLYYQEALRRDPGDVRSNTAVGIDLLKQGLFQEAAGYFDKALERDQSFYKAWYFKGLSRLNMGNPKEAEKSLNRASYDLAWYGAAQFELAQLTAASGCLEKALEHIGRSIRGNGDNAQAYAVKSLILNRLGRHREALETALEIQALDPLDFLSLSERCKALEKLGRRAEAGEVMDTLLMVTRRDSENHLELAVRYARCGCYEDAAGVLKLITGSGAGENVSPLVYYYLAYYSALSGNSKLAAGFLEKGAGISPEYCFPSRLESVPVLAWSTGQNPQDARAHYFLGTLYLSKERRQEAIASLEKAVALEPGNVVAQRDLGLALAGEGDLGRARSAYEAALKADPEASLAILELDKVYEGLGLAAEEWAGSLEKYMNTVSGSDPLLKRLISLYIQMGRYDEALEWLKSHRFHSWEGGFGVHQYWVECNISKGDNAFRAGDYEKALEYYKLSLTYPDNLEVKEQPGTIHTRKRYKIGLALEALGRKKEAGKVFESIVADKTEPDNAYQFFRGKALEKLGRKQEAQEIYRQMLAAVEKDSGSAESHPAAPEETLSNRKQKREALFCFKRSLALEGLGNPEEAELNRRRAFELDPEVIFKAFRPPLAGM
ncbi:MAG TPA: DUF5107 domain-containing protein [archaeon]|nr:DUF5107 domain-containing protein [archaeon]